MRKKLGWSEEACKWHLRQMRARLRALLAEGASGELCARHQQTIPEYIAWSLNTRSVAAGLVDGRGGESRRFERLWWHLQHCDACAAAAREVDQLEGAIEYALAPPLLLAAVCLIWLHNLASVAKAKAITATSALMPARVRAAGGGGGATGAALSTFGGKAAVCVGAAICAAAGGLVVAGSAPIAAHRPAAAHHQRAQSASRVSRPTAAASAPATAPAERQAAAPASPHTATPASPPTRSEPRLVLHPIHEAPVAKASASHDESHIPTLHLAPAEHRPEAPPLANAASLRAEEGASSPPAPSPSQGAAQGCSAPGDLGC
jgi:hypothetical protein